MSGAAAAITTPAPRIRTTLGSEVMSRPCVRSTRPSDDNRTMGLLVMGRFEITSLVAGTRLVVEGMLASEGDLLIMRNPLYEFR